MSGFPRWTTFRFSGAVREQWQLLPASSTANLWVDACVFVERRRGRSDLTRICKSEVDGQLAFAPTQLGEFKQQEYISA